MNGVHTLVSVLCAAVLQPSFPVSHSVTVVDVGACFFVMIIMVSLPQRSACVLISHACGVPYQLLQFNKALPVGTAK
jgi:hypothetical protein